jgi:hypothetical protein
VLGCAKGAFHPGARHLEGEAPGDGVGLVEETGDVSGERSDGAHVDAAVAVDGDPQDPTGELDVVEPRPRRRDQGRDEVTHS